MDNLSEEEKNKYIENINHYLDNLINICYEKSNMQEMTVTGITIIKQPIFLIFDDLLNKIEHLKNLNEHQSKEITKAVNYTFELNKEIEIKDKMIYKLAKSFLYNNKEFTRKKMSEIGVDNYLKLSEEKKIEMVIEYFREKVENEMS